MWSKCGREVQLPASAGMTPLEDGTPPVGNPGLGRPSSAALTCGAAKGTHLFFASSWRYASLDGPKPRTAAGIVHDAARERHTHWSVPPDLVAITELACGATSFSHPPRRYLLDGPTSGHGRGGRRSEGGGMGDRDRGGGLATRREHLRKQRAENPSDVVVKRETRRKKLKTATDEAKKKKKKNPEENAGPRSSRTQ